MELHFPLYDLCDAGQQAFFIRQRGNIDRPDPIGPLEEQPDGHDGIPAGPQFETVNSPKVLALIALLKKLNVVAEVREFIAEMLLVEPNPSGHLFLK